MALRTFTESNPITMCFGYKTTPMIKINKEGVTYYNSVKDKIEALKTRKKKDKFVIVWPGQWSTDVFDISEVDISKILTDYK